MNPLSESLLNKKKVSKVSMLPPWLKTSLVNLTYFTGRIFFFWKKYTHVPVGAKKILFVSLYFNGDIILASPLFKLVKNIYPHSEMHIWIKSRTSALMDGYKDTFGKVIIYDEIKTRRYDEHINSSLLSKLKFANSLKSEKYDVIIDITGLIWTSTICWLAKPKYLTGFNFLGFDFLYNFSSSAVTTGHLIDKNASVVLTNPRFKNLIKKPIKLSSFIELQESSIAFIQNKLQENLLLGKELVVIHTSAGWKAKEWSSAKFSEMINLVPDKYAIILIGSSADIKKNLEIEHLSAKNIYNYTSLLTINQTSALISLASIYIGADSGPLYIAEALGVKTISLFGPTNPEFSAPRGNNHITIYHKLFCSAETGKQNCRLLAGLNCASIDCMEMIKPEEIISKFA